jgi:hypothetical protein
MRVHHAEQMKFVQSARWDGDPGGLALFDEPWIHATKKNLSTRRLDLHSWFQAIVTPAAPPAAALFSMRTSILFIALICAALTSATIQIPFTQLSLNSAKSRDGYTVDSWLGSYMVNITLGTPPQKLAAVLSTNTVNSWVPEGRICDMRAERYRSFTYGRCLYGSFATNQSSSLQMVPEKKLQARYQSGLALSTFYAYGNATRDVIGVGDATVANMWFGVTNNTNHWLGVLGLGYNLSSAIDDYEVPSFMDGLLANKKINSKAFSIWLDEPSATSRGQLLLGAVDTAKFTPPLTRLDASNYESGFYDFAVKVASMNGSKSADSVLAPVTKLPSPLWVTVSPSDAVSNLPWSVAQAIWSLAGARYLSAYESAVIACEAASNTTGRLKLELGGSGGPTIDVPLADLILPRETWIMSPSARVSNSSRPNDLCMFGIQSNNITRRFSTYSGERRYWSIGSTMLRRTYTVMDVANQQLAFASRKYDEASKTQSNVVAFPSYGAAMPSSTRYGPATCYSFNMDECQEDNGGGSSGRAGESSGGLGQGPVVGIAVGVSLGVALLVGFGIWGFIEWSRRKRQTAAAEAKAAAIEGPQNTAAPPAPAPAPPANLAPISEEEAGRTSTSAPRPVAEQVSAPAAGLQDTRAPPPGSAL